MDGTGWKCIVDDSFGAPMVRNRIPSGAFGAVPQRGVKEAFGSTHGCKKEELQNKKVIRAFEQLWKISIVEVKLKGKTVFELNQTNKKQVI